MKTYRVKILSQALDEIEALVDYIALDSVENALNWYERLKEKIYSLDNMPQRCPLADENLYFDFDLYCLVVDGYRVLYRINKSTVEVLHVKHPRMNR